MTDRPLVFLDLETTGLNPSLCYIWEFAAIRRELDGTETTYHHFVAHDERAAEKLPEVFLQKYRARYREEDALNLADFIAMVQEVTTNATIVGACPWFDTGFLTSYLEMARVVPDWHYRLIDIESMVAGFRRSPVNGLSEAAKFFEIEYSAHEALADAEVVKKIYDKVML